MASGYASNIPIENAAPEPELMPESMCVICKKRVNTDEATGICRVCTKALAA